MAGPAGPSRPATRRPASRSPAVGCLVSPVTWVHHLVWLIPALILLVDNAMAAPAGRRRRVLLVAATIGYAVLISRTVWFWEKDFTGVDGFLGSNA